MITLFMFNKHCIQFTCFVFTFIFTDFKSKQLIFEMSLNEMESLEDKYRSYSLSLRWFVSITSSVSVTRRQTQNFVETLPEEYYTERIWI